ELDLAPFRQHHNIEQPPITHQCLALQPFERRPILCLDREPFLGHHTETHRRPLRIGVRAGAEGSRHGADVVLGLGLAVERLGPLVAVVVDPPGHPSLALPVAGGDDLRSGYPVPGVHTPAAGAGVVGRIRDLLPPPWRAMPAIFYACTRAALHPVNDTVLRTVCGPDNLSKLSWLTRYGI